MASLLSFMFVLAFYGVIQDVIAAPEQGLWRFDIDKNDITQNKMNEKNVQLYKSLFNGSHIGLSVICEGNNAEEVNLTIRWLVRHTPCANEYMTLPAELPVLFLNQPERVYTDPMPYKSSSYLKGEIHGICSKPNLEISHPFVSEKPHVVNYEHETSPPENKAAAEKTSDKKISSETSPEELAESPEKVAKRSMLDEEESVRILKKRSANETSKEKSAANAESTSIKAHSTEHEKSDRLVKVWEDGYYLLVLQFVVPSRKIPDDFKVQVTVRMSYGNSYLSAVDWPLLIFFGVMGLVYIFFGIFWLVMLACNWRDLLRVQFWIGAVIFLGMLEKAVFFGEYENVNSTGQSVKGAIIVAELVSCLKRTLARMLVLIVSLGYGIVKPRLGQTFHKVLFVGIVFFILASIESCTRALSGRADQSVKLLVASIPVAVADAIICWWIFSSLLQTTRTLRLRRNVVKLSLYRHFTNTLIFSVIASVAYMIWFVTQHRLKTCLSDWRELWVDDAFWHLLFSAMLFVIMILWRPSANNQRYAFSPLLDSAEDDVDDDQTLSDAYEGMKMRSTTAQQKNGSPRTKDDQKGEDDLKWVEDNIPTSIVDRVLPALDSDEEIMNAKFEASKME